MDYTGLPKVISFTSGQSLTCINITIIDDNIVEYKENFTVKLLSNFSGVSVSRIQSVIEISDNDEGRIGHFTSDT